MQFAFPDQNGKPDKTSGGKALYNQEFKHEIPEGWGVEKKADIDHTDFRGIPKLQIVHTM